MSITLGLIVGSGFDYLGLEVLSRNPSKTPYGTPSSPILEVGLGGLRVACIARHGEQQPIPPHDVNYRANLWCLHQHGVGRCIAVNAVGAISEGFAPGELAVPDQLIDYTWGREHTYRDGNFDAPDHIDFTEPFDPELRGAIAVAAHDVGCPVRAGVYGVTQGPRLETAAEIVRLERDGCAMVGMTAMPEAALARELGIAYAICAIAVNFAAGRGPGEPIHARLEDHAKRGMRRAGEVLERVIGTDAAVAT